MPFTVMPCSASSMAICRVRPITAAFDVPYAVRPMLARMPLMEATLMMRPHPCSRITCAACWLHSSVPVRLTFISRCQPSKSVSRNDWVRAIPALLTNTSQRPQRARSSSNKAVIDAASPMSITSAKASMPCSRNPCTLSSAACRSMSATTTVWPSCPRRSAMAAPIPMAAPVTSATRPTAVAGKVFFANWLMSALS